MPALYPLTFEPRVKERVWGGRMLETLYGKRLPPAVPIGESWELSDRPGDESVIANGPLAGRTMRWLMEQHGADVLGGAPAADGRFPVLCKLLDARETLSLQVHPPPRAAHLGEPKTEMWYIASAAPGAELYVGLKRGVTRARFEQAITSGDAAACLHRLRVRAGDAMFLPSGRVHAIGAGLVIFEIQQNSDTTFRVFDWNRVGLDGSPRQLHIAESLESIDFADIEPALIEPEERAVDGVRIRPLVRDALFDVDLVRAVSNDRRRIQPGRARVIAVVEGDVMVKSGAGTQALAPGTFCLIPAALDDVEVVAGAPSSYLLVASSGGS